MLGINFSKSYRLVCVGGLVFGLLGCLSGGGGGGSGGTTASGGGGGGGGGGVVCSAAPPSPVASAPGAIWPANGACIADASTDFLSADYYVDAARADNSGDGRSPGTAWKTIAYALVNAPAGKTVFVMTGNYGQVSEIAPILRGSYLTLRAAPGHSPVITKLNIKYVVKSPAFLRFVGFSIKNTDRNPDNSELVHVENATDVELLNNTISSDPTRGSGYAMALLGDTVGNPHYLYGVVFTNTERVLIKSNCVSGVLVGIRVGGSSAVSLKRNFIAPQAETAIQYFPNNSNVLIEDNHIRGMAFTPYCLDNPLPATAAACVTVGDPNALWDPHGSMISMRGDGATIRNNIMHGMGSTAAIRTYIPDVNGGNLAYSNITIEGNLIYDVFNPQMIQFSNLGNNVLLRNNLLVSRYRLEPPCPDGKVRAAAAKYDTALYISNLAATYANDLRLVNNIHIGSTLLRGASGADANNIFWSYALTAFDYVGSSLSGTSKIVTSSVTNACGVYPDYFENPNFFVPPINYAPENGQLLEYRALATSEAKNFGNEAAQLARKLGVLDVNGFFINEAGDRCTGEHSAGPYEF